MTCDNLGNPYTPPKTESLAEARTSAIGLWHVWAVLQVTAIAALPSILLSSIYTFAFRTAMFLGRWPYYGHPDPKDLPERFHPQSEWLEIIIPTVTYAVSVLSLTFLVLRFARPDRRILAAIGAALAAWLLSYSVMLLDPFGVLDWWAD